MAIDPETYSQEENPNNVVIREFVYSWENPEGQEQEIEIVTCPHCNGVFAVDSTYLDQVDDVVHCPMCCIEVIIVEELGGKND